MVFIFPILGIIFSALTVLLRKTTGSEAVFDGIFYAFDYTLLFALLFVSFLVVLSLLVDTKKTSEKFDKFYNAVIALPLKLRFPPAT